MLIVSALSNCARVVAPTGGPRDSIPPTIEESYPAQGQLHVPTDVEIEVIFDEFVKGNSLSKNLLISPRLSGRFTPFLNKKKLELSFDSLLSDSTTYVINFREGIADATEGNSAEGLSLVFSTGDYIDSLSLSGSVVDLLTQEKGDGYLVTLYSEQDTINMLDGSPLYLSKADTTGRFFFTNLRPDKYWLYAFQDENENTKLDPAEEAHAFWPQLINPQDLDSTELVLQAHVIDIRPLEIKQLSPTGLYFTGKFSKPITDYTLTTEDSTELIANLIETREELLIYNPGLEPDVDSLLTTMSVRDTLGYQADSTFYLKYRATRRSPAAMTTTLAFEKTPKGDSLRATISADKPLQSVQPDSMLLYLDTTATYQPTRADIRFSQDRKQVYLQLPSDTLAFTKRVFLDTLQQEYTLPFSEVPRYGLVLAPASVISYEGDSSEVMDATVQPLLQEDLAKFSGTITTDYTSYEVQLITPEFAVVQTLDSPVQYTFDNIAPGTYGIRVLIDEDEDGVYEGSDFQQLRPAEPVWVYPDKIQLRANWELIDINLSF